MLRGVAHTEQSLLASLLAIRVSCLPAPQAATTSNTTSKSAAVQATGGGSYQTFKGDGSTGAGWPDKSAWVAFEDAFGNNKATMQTFDSDDEINDIHDSINSVSSQTGVDSRFILAVMMQESRGNVRVGTTAVDHANPGLMQSHQGVDCIGQTPCPASVITQMIQDGAGGTSSGDGLKQLVNFRASSPLFSNANSEIYFRGISGDQAIDVYKAARIYNSGSLDASGDLATNGATPCYASDIANRLIGFLGDSPCVDADVVPAA